MNVGSTQIDAMAASATNGLHTVMLNKALTASAVQMTQLLEGLPQKDNAGQLIDVQA